MLLFSKENSAFDFAALSRPNRILRHRWTSDVYTLGSWAFQSTTTSEKDADRLAMPLPSEADPRLLFAGEATDTRFLGNLLKGTS